MKGTKHRQGLDELLGSTEKPGTLFRHPKMMWVLRTQTKRVSEGTL